MSFALPRSRTGNLAPAVAAAVVLCGAALSADGTAEAAEIAEPHLFKTRTVTKPGGSKKRTLKAETRSGEIARYLVVKRKKVDGVDWVGLRPPWRGNRAVVWARADQFRIFRAPTRLVLRLKSRVLTLKVGGKVRWRTGVVIGKPSTPTPRGLFALYDRYRVTRTNLGPEWADFRPWVFELTAHSEKLRRFQGGPARIALHGRHGKLRAPLGTARSNGCIRVPDHKLRSIRRNAILGTPILIK